MAWTADFETCDDRCFHDGVPHEVHVWLWALCDIDTLSVSYGTDIHTFLYDISRMCAGGEIWFHNLAYDGTHIIDALLRAGWSWSDEDKAPGTFSTLISDTGKFYHIGITWGDGTHVDIYDSLKKFPFSVDALGKRFDMPEQKGHIDYRAWRDYGYIPTREEYGYIHNDVVITARAMHEDYMQGLTRMTIGSDCLHWYKGLMGRRFGRLFPRLNRFQDAFIRAAYRGGYTYCRARFQGETVGPGISVDYNSMYPSQMESQAYPVGEPVYFPGRYEDDPDYPLYVQRMRVRFRLKQRGVPTIQLKASPYFGAHEYVEECDDAVEITLSSVDIYIMGLNYDYEVTEWLGGYKFRAMRGIFHEYIDYWRGIKQTSTGITRQLAKLFLNNLYGKFGSNPETGSKVPYLAHDGIVRFTDEHDSRDAVYIPVAVFVTAYARRELIEAIHANYDRFVYCDTDSMHLLGTDAPRGIRLHDSEFMAWKVEGEFTQARHLRAKTYMWDLNGRWEVKCAGMPLNVKKHIAFDDFDIGYSNMGASGQVREGEGKLVPVMVRGGRTLVDRPFKIR